ncbi:hypothetical protein LIER_11562 [Lithospermum erythrorhizon]|uniref:EGF-like domain-containing protein n=1 Tax=Lithospermum erythrorhizon TaxID=34254 RepID=A0AAV3PPY3_LITER
MGILNNTFSTLALLFLCLQQPRVATCFDFGTVIAPIVDGFLCNLAPCGKGVCKLTNNATFPGYECECGPGWNQVGPKFMPCVVPNCTLDSSCMATPGKANGHFSPLDFCTYADCGGGVCNNTAFPYSCECDEGYGNLLNMKLFSCVKDCALGLDCNHLQIPLQNNTVKPNNTDTNGSLVSSSSSGNLILLLVLGISICMILWR